MIPRRTLAIGAVLFLALGTGPTVGNVGGCGRTATELNEAAFANARKTVDCRRCGDCGLSTARCQRACDPQAVPDT